MTRSKKTSKLRVTGLCVVNSPETGEIPAQMASNAEKDYFDDVIMKANDLPSMTSFTNRVKENQHRGKDMDK